MITTQTETILAQATPGAASGEGILFPVVLIALSVFLVGIACFLLLVRVIFKKNGRFPSPHIHDNAALRKRGIDCAGHQSNN